MQWMKWLQQFRKSNKELTKTAYIKKIAGKAIALVVLSFMVIITYGETIGIVYEAATDKDARRQEMNCVQDWQTGDYARLYETLELYNMYDEEYDRYWEISNAYRDYMKWQMWQRAAIVNSENQVYTDKAKAYEEIMRSHYKNCSFAENKEKLEAFLQ